MPPEKPPVATPPGKDDDDLGEAPDWQDCGTGWRAQFINLAADDPWVTPRPRDGEVPTTVEGLSRQTKPAVKPAPTMASTSSGWAARSRLASV